MTDICTRESTRVELKSIIVPDTYNLMSWTRDEYLGELVSHISCWIPSEHPWCYIRAKYLRYIMSEFLSEILCLCTSSRLNSSLEEDTISLNPLCIFTRCAPKHLDTITVRYSMISLILSLPCRDDDNSLCNCLEESPDDTISTSMIKVRRIECSPIHDD